jgi:hypothetical protein
MIVKRVDFSLPRIGYLYAFTTPVDWWYGWQPYTDIQHADASPFTIHSPLAPPDEMYNDTRRFYQLAQRAAKDHAGWEGDIREGPYMAGYVIPGDPTSHVIIGWKHDNNGDTFIASPVQLWREGKDNYDHSIQVEVQFRY